MEGFWDSFSKWFNEKTSSPLYFTYIAFFVAWNWKFFQIIFLEDASVFSVPRIEYMDSHFLFSFSIPWAWHWIVVVCVWFVNTLWHILPPVAFAFLSIKYLPFAHKWAFDIYVENHFERKRVYREANLNYEKDKTENLKEVASEKKKQAVQKNIIAKSQTNEEVWGREYEEFKKTTFFDQFSHLKTVIYENAGLLRSNFSSEMKAYCDTNGIISIKDDKFSNERASLTEKGKYFMKRYINETTL